MSIQANQPSFQRAARMLTGDAPAGRKLESVPVEGLATQACLSDDGRFVAFVAQARKQEWQGGRVTTPPYDVFLKDRLTGDLQVITRGSNGSSSGVTMSADGRLVAFTSSASNLVEGDTNNTSDVFLYDRLSGQTRLVSCAQDGTQGNLASYAPQLSADGKVLAFISTANNLTDEPTNCNQKAMVKDLSTGRVEVVSGPATGMVEQLALSGDGSRVVFGYMGQSLDPAVKPPTEWGRELYHPQIYLHERASGQTRQISRNGEGEGADGRCLDPTISRDGRRVAFATAASNLSPGVAAGMLAVFQGWVDQDLEHLGTGLAPTFSGNGEWIGWQSDGQIELRGPEGQQLVVDRPEGSPLEPVRSLNPQLSQDANTVVFVTQERDRDEVGGMRSRVHTFDFEHARAQLDWTGEKDEPGGPVSLQSNAVIVGGVRLRRRG